MAVEHEGARPRPVNLLPDAQSAAMELAGTPRAAPLSRLFLREHLDGYIDADTLATAELLTTELVTNALLHARSRIQIVLNWDAHDLLVGVHDQHPAGPQRTIALSDLVETGRGMTIVTALADDMGWEQLPDGAGKVMWFTLTLGSHQATRGESMTSGDSADTRLYSPADRQP